MQQPEKLGENLKSEQSTKKEKAWLTKWSNDEDKKVFDDLKKEKLKYIEGLISGVKADKSFKKDEVLTTTDIEGDVIPFLTELKLGGMVKNVTFNEKTNRLELTLNEDWRGALAFCGDLTSFKKTGMNYLVDDRHQFGNEIVIELFEDLLDKLEEHNRPIRERNKSTQNKEKEEEAKLVAVPGNHEFLHFCGVDDMPPLYANNTDYQPKFYYGENNQQVFYITPKHALRIKVRAARVLAKWQLYQFQQALRNRYNIEDDDYGDKYSDVDYEKRLNKYCEELKTYIDECEFLLEAICDNKKWEDIKLALEDLYVPSDPSDPESLETYQDRMEDKYKELIEDKRTHIQALKVLMVEHSALHSKCILSHKGKKLRVLHYVGFGADRKDLPPHRDDWFENEELIAKWKEQCNNRQFFKNLNDNKWNLGGVGNRIHYNKECTEEMDYLNMTTDGNGIFTISGHNGNPLPKTDKYQICIDDGRKSIANDAFIFMQEGNMKRCIYLIDSGTNEVISETMDNLDEPSPIKWKKAQMSKKKEEKKEEQPAKQPNEKKEDVKETNIEGVKIEENRRGNYSVPIEEEGENNDSDEFDDYEIIEGDQDYQNNEVIQQQEKTCAQDEKSNENEQNDQLHPKVIETFERLKHFSFKQGNLPVNQVNNNEDLKKSNEPNVGQKVNPFANNAGGVGKNLSEWAANKEEQNKKDALTNTGFFSGQNNGENVPVDNVEPKPSEEEKKEEDQNEDNQVDRLKHSIFSLGGGNGKKDNIFDDKDNPYDNKPPEEEEKEILIDSNNKSENYEANKRINEFYCNAKVQKQRSMSASNKGMDNRIKENVLIKRGNDLRSMKQTNINNRPNIEGNVGKKKNDNNQNSQNERRYENIKAMEKAGFDQLTDEEIEQYANALVAITNAKLGKGIPEHYHNFWEPLIQAVIDGREDEVRRLTETNNPNRPSDVSQKAIVYALKCFDCIKPDTIQQYGWWGKLCSFGENNAKKRRVNHLWKIMQGRYARDLEPQEKTEFKQGLKNYDSYLKNPNAVRAVSKPRRREINLTELLSLAQIQSRLRCGCCGRGSVEVQQ